MSLENKAQILDAVTSSTSVTCGIRDIVQNLKWKTSRIIALSKEMSEERLIEFRTIKSPIRGRPKKAIVVTNLGLDFLETYRMLGTKPLRARKQDLERAAKDALHTERLIERGHQPFKLFLELNEIVRNISNSSKTNQSIWQL